MSVYGLTTAEQNHKLESKRSVSLANCSKTNGNSIGLVKRTKDTYREVRGDWESGENKGIAGAFEFQLLLKLISFAKTINPKHFAC